MKLAVKHMFVNIKQLFRRKIIVDGFGDLQQPMQLKFFRLQFKRDFIHFCNAGNMFFSSQLINRLKFEIVFEFLVVHQIENSCVVRRIQRNTN